MDEWQKVNPNKKRYSWMRNSDGTQSRLDRIYVNEEFYNNCMDWKIKLAPIPSNHNLVPVRISTSTAPSIGRGRWAIPTRLLKNKTIKNIVQNLGKELEWHMKDTKPRTPVLRFQTHFNFFHS